MIALFGKLPAKRDFVARDMPGPVLSVVDPFLQSAVAEGRDALGAGWTDAFLSAPIWRFWWSREVCTAGARGAIMPSVDAVGRYFPLVALSLASEGTDHPLPTAADEPWYEALEDALLSALEHGRTLDDLLASLATVLDDPAPAIPSLTGTLWWTIAASGAGPRKAAWSGLPPPRTFGLMLAGRAPETAPHGEPVP